MNFVGITVACGWWWWWLGFRRRKIAAEKPSLQPPKWLSHITSHQIPRRSRTRGGSLFTVCKVYNCRQRPRKSNIKEGEGREREGKKKKKFLLLRNYLRFRHRTSLLARGRSDGILEEFFDRVVNSHRILRPGEGAVDTRGGLGRVPAEKRIAFQECDVHTAFNQRVCCGEPREAATNNDCGRHCLLS